MAQDRGEIHTLIQFHPNDLMTSSRAFCSKAFLLAEDDKITDRTITSQINRR